MDILTTMNASAINAFRSLMPPLGTASSNNQIMGNVVFLHLTIAALLAFGMDPLCATLWKKKNDNQDDENDDDNNGKQSNDKHRRRRPVTFVSALLYGALRHVATAARFYLVLVVGAELYALVPTSTTNIILPYNEKRGGGREEEECTTSDNPSYNDNDDNNNASTHSPFLTSSIAAWLAGILWLGLTVSSVKHTLLLQSVAGHTLGRVALMDRFLDLGIAVVVILNMMDAMDMDASSSSTSSSMSIGVQSVLSAGGVGALAFSLASQDLAQGLVGGLAVQAWDAFTVGEIVLLDDGTEGTITEIGLVETHVKGYDAVVTRIPNKQLTTARVSNLSRVKTSRIVQPLRFAYHDLEKLPAVLERIKQEIQTSCPTVITDGSSAFLAVLEEYRADHIGGLVIANFKIPPRTLEFMNNRQECLLAIARAMKAHDVAFAMPVMEYRGSTSSSSSNNQMTTTNQD